MKACNRALSMLCLALLVLTGCDSQVNNVKTETVKIYGNCGMCKKTIEKAGNVEGIAMVVWNKDSKMATFTYDSIRTNSNDILKRIADAGYDSEKFTAPNNVYNNLHKCCRYESPNKN